jgi:pimeloyl-ACP methyl ester carboxylesterase
MGYTTAREVKDLEAVRARTGAPQVVLIGHSWGARFVAAYAQEHPNRVAALVLTAPGDLPLEGAEVPPGDLTTRLDTSELVKEYLRLLRPRNLFAYSLTTADPRVAHSMAGDQEMDRRFSAIYRDSTPALFCDQGLTDRVGTTSVGYYAHYVPQLHPDPAGVPLHLDQLTMIKVSGAGDQAGLRLRGMVRCAGLSARVPLCTAGDDSNAGHVAYIEQPALYTNLVHAILADEKLPLPTIDWTTIPYGYRGTR